MAEYIVEDSLLFQMTNNDSFRFICSGPAPAPGMDYYGGAPPPSQQSYAALPPSTTSAPQPNGYNADPWGSASVGGGSYSTAPNPTHGAPGAAYMPPAPAPAYGAPSVDPFEQQSAYGAPPQDFAAPPQNQYGAPAPTPDFAAPPAANPFGAPALPSYGQQQTHPPPETPTGAVVPGGQNYTPTTQASTLGFASPVANNAPAQDPFGTQAQDPFAPAPATQPAPAPEQFPAAGPEAGSNDPALLSMNVLSGQQQPLVSDDMKSGGNGGTVADQAYAKLMNMNAFDLVKGKEEQARANPFDMGGSSNAPRNQASLADMKAKKSSTVSDSDKVWW